MLISAWQTIQFSVLTMNQNKEMQQASASVRGGFDASPCALSMLEAGPALNRKRHKANLHSERWALTKSQP